MKSKKIANQLLWLLKNNIHSVELIDADQKVFSKRLDKIAAILKDNSAILNVNIQDNGYIARIGAQWR